MGYYYLFVCMEVVCANQVKTRHFFLLWLVVRASNSSLAAVVVNLTDSTRILSIYSAIISTTTMGNNNKTQFSNWCGEIANFKITVFLHT